VRDDWLADSRLLFNEQSLSSFSRDARSESGSRHAMAAKQLHAAVQHAAPAMGEERGQRKRSELTIDTSWWFGLNLGPVSCEFNTKGPFIT
jgi:hypothetical protein